MKQVSVYMESRIKKAVGKWNQRASDLKADSYALFLAYKHPNTPWFAKAIVGLVIAYTFNPIDLVPDFIPIAGYLDDLILVPLGIVLAIKLIPAEVMADCRRKAYANAGIGRKVTWLTSLIIVTIWVGVATICIIWFINRLR